MDIDETKTHYQNYYQTIVKPRREAAKAAKLATLGVARLPRGPGRKYVTDRIHLHLTFSDEMTQFIREQSTEIGYQAFFDNLVQNEMKRVSGNPEK